MSICVYFIFSYFIGRERKDGKEKRKMGGLQPPKMTHAPDHAAGIKQQNLMVVCWQMVGPTLKQHWLLVSNQTLGQRGWRNVGPVFHISTGPMSSANHLPMYCMTLAQHWSNLCLLAGL